MSSNKSDGTRENVLTHEQKRLAYFRCQLKKAEERCSRLKRLCDKGDSQSRTRLDELL